MLALIPARSPWPFVRALPTDWYNGNLTTESNTIPTPASDIAMAVSTRALSWCPISKTKIALVFAGVQAGVNKYYVQIVNFVDKKPVFKAPSFIANMNGNSAVQHPMMRITKITDSRLVLSIPENVNVKNGLATVHSFALLNVNSDDSVSLVSRTAATTTATASDSLQPQLPLLLSAGNGIAWYNGTTSGSRGQGAAKDYQMMFKITMSGDTIVAEKARGSANYQATSMAPLYSGHRVDRKGKVWSLVAAETAAFYLDFSTGSFDDGRNAYYATSAPSYTRNIVPIEGDKFVNFNGAQVVVSQFTRSASNGYIQGITALSSTASGIDFATLTMEDAIWVDQTTFIVIAGVGNPPAALSSNLINTPDIVARMSTDLRVYVFRYDPATNAVNASANSKLLGLSLSKQTYDSMLHNIDDSTVAIIGTFAPQNTADTTHRVMILNSGVAPSMVFDTTLWSQFSFRDNLAIDDVTQAPVLLSNATITGNKLVNTASTDKPMDMAMPLYLSAAEDFSIEGWLNMSSIPDAAAALSMYAPSGSTDFAFFLGAQANGTVIAIVNDNGASPNTGRITVPAAGFTLNADHHLAVGRVAGVLTIYLNGVPIYSGPNATATFRSTEFLNIRNGAIGKRWNMRIFRGKSAYNGPFTPPTILPTITPAVYDEAVAADIVFQSCMRQNSLVNEATGENITLLGTATVAYGRLNIQPQATSRFSAPCAYFGAADFTIECKVRMPVNPATAESGIMGQYGNAFDANCNWLMWTSGSRGVIFYWVDSAGSARNIQASVPLPLNSDCHVVVEKVGSTITMYFDGVKVAEGSAPIPFINRAALRPLRNLWDNTSGTANTLQVTNIRIAKRAMYNGKITPASTLPRIKMAGTTIIDKGSLALGSGVGTSVVADGVRITPGSYITIPPSQALVLGSGDFTIDMEFSLQSSQPSGANGSLVALVFWGNVATPGSPMNYEVNYNFGTGNLGFSVGNESSAQYRIFPANFALNTMYKVQVTRSSGMLSFWVDNVKIGESAFTDDIQLDTNTQFLIGRRIGASGGVIWNSDMTLKNFRIVRASRANL